MLKLWIILESSEVHVQLVLLQFLSYLSHFIIIFPFFYGLLIYYWHSLDSAWTVQSSGIWSILKIPTSQPERKRSRENKRVCSRVCSQSSPEGCSLVCFSDLIKHHSRAGSSSGNKESYQSIEIQSQYPDNYAHLTSAVNLLILTSNVKCFASLSNIKLHKDAEINIDTEVLHRCPASLELKNISNIRQKF